jgi:hypothetical protein
MHGESSEPEQTLDHHAVDRVRATTTSATSPPPSRISSICSIAARGIRPLNRNRHGMRATPRQVRVARDGEGEHWRAQGAWQDEAQLSDGTLRLVGL